MLTQVNTAELVRAVRTDAGLSLRALADAAGVATSTVHRIERGDLNPTVELLERIVEAAGTRLVMATEPDSARSLVGFALALRGDLAADDHTTPVRRAAEFAARYETADTETRHRMVAADPPSTGDERWDAFIGALTEWLTVRHGLPTPAWSRRPERYLDYGWWVTPMASLHAWEYAGSPASFKTRGVYLHRESLTNV
jgi:transcriptional regulator with XRE-family HTH domain